MNGNSKGQMFIIAAIIVSISLIMLKQYFGVYALIEENRFQETQSITDKTRNVQEEYENIINLAIDKPNINGTIKNELYNFSSYLREQENSRIIYMFAYVNKSVNEIQVTVGNFMGDSISISLTAKGTIVDTIELRDIVDKEALSFIFSTPPGFDGTVNITFEYHLQNEIIKEKASIDLSKNRQLLFYDISLQSSSSEMRVKDVYAPVLQQMVELPSNEQDPGQAICGNGRCEAGETCSNCCGDCCPPVCGDNVCRSLCGETCSNCPGDCGSCNPPPCSKCPPIETVPCCSECISTPCGSCNLDC